MGQEEVLKVLRKNGEWMIAADIQRKLNQNVALINRALRALYNHGEVMRKKTELRPDIGKRINRWKIKD